MKKFISLALAAAMTLSLVPVSAFASTDNRISNVVTVEKDDVLKNAPQVVIMNDKGDIKAEKFSFELVLDGAEWDDVNKVEIYEADTVKFITNVTAGFVQTGEEPASGDSAASATSDLTKVYAGSAGNATGYLATVEKLSSTRALVTIDAKGKAVPDGGLKITLNGAKITGDKATVTVDPRQSTVSADTFTFAKSVDGGTVATIDDTTDFTGITEIKPILLEEVTAGTIDENDEITLKLNSGFKFTNAGTVSVISGDLDLGSKTYEIVSDDNRTIKLKLGSDVTKSKKASILKFEGIKIDEDGASEGKVAEITVNGTNVDKTTLEVGTYVDYNVSVSAEDKDLPTIYSGVAVDDDNNETLKLTVKEGVSDSWFLDSRKTTFTFPEGVKVQAVNVDSDTDKIQSESSLENNNFTIDGNEVTFSGAKKTASTDKAKLVVSFDVIVAPDFTGDIKCTVGGAAVAEDTEVTLAKAVAPVTVEAEKTSVAIDYRNVAVGDITIKEAEAGLWGKGQTIVLQAENMSFESGMKAEVVEGDGEIKKLDVNGGKITITVDSESSKTPMTIKLTDASLYLDRTLPAGDYALNLVAKDKATDVMFETYNEKDGGDYENTPSEFGFDVDEVEVLKDYVTVATAGRDQGTTFTTNVVVTIDSTTMLVDGKEVTLDVPAYLSAEGWTMLPVRAVTESLASASNSEPVDWIAGNPGTIMIYYGDKTVSMTLGSTTMYINGTPVPMSTAPVIVNDRAFLPMRDLGRALGLSDSQIAWDATARTATFNPTTTAAE